MYICVYFFYTDFLISNSFHVMVRKTLTIKTIIWLRDEHLQSGAVFRIRTILNELDAADLTHHEKLLIKYVKLLLYSRHSQVALSGFTRSQR